MNLERVKHVDIVKNKLASHARLELPSETGLDRTQVSSSISYLRRKGEIPPPTPAETKRAMSESVSRARGGVSLAIDPYMRMGMTPLEIKVALSLNGEDSFTLKQINQCVSKARLRGMINPPTEQDKRDARKNTSLDKATIQRKVFFWLESARVASQIEANISGRVDWMKWITKCMRSGLFTIEGVYNGADERGLYRNVVGQGRFRQFGETDEEGRMVMDNLEMVLKRREARNRNLKIVS